MLFWDLLRDFFVKYIFGGTTSTGFGYVGCLGMGHLYINGNLDDSWTIFNGELAYNVGSFASPEGVGVIYLSVNDWLSTTATIISMVGICVGLFLLIRWFFKIGAGFIGLRG